MDGESQPEVDRSYATSNSDLFILWTETHKLTLSGFCCLQTTLQTVPIIPGKQTLRIPNATSYFTTGGSHEEIFSASFSLVSSFITPCRGGAKWSSSLPMKACMIQMLLGIHKPSFFHPARNT